MHPIEQRIHAPSDRDVYEVIREEFPKKSDVEIIAELTRMIVIVAVCWNDIVEGKQSAESVLDRYIFRQCNELAECFPWPTD
jgi:hypothetical protein